MAAQIEHLTLILLSFSPGTSLGQQSHTLLLTLSLSPPHPFNLSPATGVRLVSTLCVKLAAESVSAKDHLSQQTNRLVAPHLSWGTQIWVSTEAHANEAALRRLEKG